MLQGTALRASRALNTRLPQRAVASPFQASRQSFAVASASTRPAAFASRRWYSDAKAEAKQKEAEKVQEDEVLKSGENGEVEKLKKDLEAKSKEVINLKDSYLRSVADYRNLQDRTQRERQQTIDFALSRFARDLLPSIDNLTHALNSIPSERLTTPGEQAHSDLKNLHEGVKMMETVLLDVLKKHGLEKQNPVGEVFDPKVHDAVFQAPQSDKTDGTVFHVQNPGYVLNGRVLRAAQVGVVKNA